MRKRGVKDNKNEGMEKRWEWKKYCPRNEKGGKSEIRKKERLKKEDNKERKKNEIEAGEVWRDGK